MDPRLPVLIGGGQVNQRDGEGDLEPVGLMAEALRRAAADSGAPDPARLLAGADTIAAVNVISWRYADPATLVAGLVGADPARTWYTTAAGTSPQSLVSRAALDIAAGRADLVLVCGGEAWRTRTRLRREDRKPDWTVQPDDAAPDWTLGEGSLPMAHPVEIERGVVMPVQVYPIYESALRARAGRSQEEHLVHLSELWAGFSAVASTNPDAWIQRAYTAEEIRTFGPDNRLVGWPYPKLMNSNSAVEQGAAVLVCSVERAEALGVPRDRWVFPWAGSDANDTPFVSNRLELAGSPAIRAAGRTTFDLAGVGPDDLAHVDLYSCFPSAVEVAALELGFDTSPGLHGHGRPLTVTGGLSFAGGPWNDYVSHSIATMQRVLREDAGSVGLITANGGFLTKHALGVYSTEPPRSGRYRWESSQDAADAAGSIELAPDWQGDMTVEGATVMHDRSGEPERGIVLARTADGRRAWGTTSDAEVMKVIVADEPVGRAGTVGPDGDFELA
jgi:acetyl-CoA C-acetyltransferase